MSIEFMVIAAPRSGTAWAANWLTTDTTLCLHDPLYRYAWTELEALASARILGMACTVSALLNVNAHPARKIVLHRDPIEVRESMARLGIQGDYDFAALDQVQGKHYPWTALFEDPAPLYEYLLEQPFDAERHQLLRSLNVQNLDLIQALQRGDHGALASA
jgi:hypothetical protein